MPDLEQAGYKIFWMPARRVDGSYGIMIAIKKRFDVDMIEAVCKPSDETPPIQLMQEFHDDADPPDVSVALASEIAMEKVRVDIIVLGTAYAPNGQAVPKFDVNVRIPGVINRTLRIFGDRYCEWFPPVKDLTYKDLAKGEEWQWLDPDFSEPAPIEKLPLRYEYAYGGWAKIVMSDDEQEIAEEAQAVGEIKEKRRDRKKEIEEEILAEEKAKKEAAQKKGQPEPSIKDDEAAKLADDAFAVGEDEVVKEGGTKVIDLDMVARIDAEEAARETDMKVTSRYHLGEDDARPPEGQAPEDEEAAEGEEDAEGDEEGEGDEKKEDDMSEFFTSSAGATSMVDIAALGETNDELAELLKDNAAKRRASEMDQVTDARQIRTEGMEDINLYGDDWAAQYTQKRPEVKQKRKREESELPEIPCASNTCGKGFLVNPREEAVQGLQLPNIEDPDDLITPEELLVELNEEFDLKKLRTPAGWAPYPMGWYPRAGYFGCYEWDLEAAEAAMEKAKEAYDEEDPDDKPIIDVIDGIEIPMMQPRAFQEAHPKMQAEEVRGDEEVYFTNLTPDGNLFFRLPGLHPTATIDLSMGPEPVTINIDQVTFDLRDAEKPAVEMIWRGWHPIRDFDVLGETPYRGINIIEVDQFEWLDVKRDEAKSANKEKKSGDGLTSAVAAITDEDLEKMDAEAEYKKQFAKTRGGKGVRIDDGTDAQVFDQTEDRQLTDDVWDDNIRGHKDDFEAQAAAIAAEKDKAKLKDVRKKAREQADEEFGIIRDDDGEILVTDEDVE